MSYRTFDPENCYTNQNVARDKIQPYIRHGVDQGSRSEVKVEIKISGVTSVSISDVRLQVLTGHILVQQNKDRIISLGIFAVSHRSTLVLTSTLNFNFDNLALGCAAHGCKL